MKELRNRIGYGQYALAKHHDSFLSPADLAEYKAKRATHTIAVFSVLASLPISFMLVKQLKADP